MSAGTRRDTRGHSTNVPNGAMGDTPLRGVSPLAAPSIGSRLGELSRRVGRLSPSWRDPEKYFEDRDEIERELRRMAREVERG